MNSLVAGQVSLIAESSLTTVTLVWLVTVDLDHVVFKGIFLCELGVTTTTEKGVVCRKVKRSCGQCTSLVLFKITLQNDLWHFIYVAELTTTGGRIL